MLVYNLTSRPTDMLCHLLFLFAVSSVVLGYDPDDFIHALGANRLGFWGSTQACANGSYAYSFEIKLENEHGILDDDTSVNAIKLHCATPDGTGTGEVTSSSMNRGSWTGVHGCSDGSFLKGYQLKSQLSGMVNADYTAANGLRMWCSGAEGEILAAPENKWGSWLEHVDCKNNKIVCGLMTRVQDDQGALHDDTALNDVRFLCCDPPQ